MRHLHLKIILFLLFISILSTVLAQPTPVTTGTSSKIVIVTGARFTYPLVQRWIDEYNRVEPAAQIIIDSRGSSDPAAFDILIEAYEQADAVKKLRDFAYIGRYPILPVANRTSAFASYYSEKGLTRQLITQVFFHDLYSDKENEQPIRFPYTVYNRLQKAGAPIVFTTYFGFAQKDIRGKAIAGSDEHLLKALLRDSAGVSYLPLTLIYDCVSGKLVRGLTVLPVDTNGNGKISDDEKNYSSLTQVLKNLDEKEQKDIYNIPIGYVHLSVAKSNQSPEAIAFIKWVVANGVKDLADFGYLKPEPGKENSDLFAGGHLNN